MNQDLKNYFLLDCFFSEKLYAPKQLTHSAKLLCDIFPEASEAKETRSQTDSRTTACARYTFTPSVTGKPPEYAKTKDILRVMKMLGHESIQNMLYLFS